MTGLARAAISLVAAAGCARPPAAVATAGQPALCAASPPRPSPPPAARFPVDHLAPAWRSAATVEEVMAGGTLLVATGAPAWRHELVDAATGAPRHFTDAAWPREATAGPRLVVAGRRLIVVGDDRLSAVDRDADALAWTAPLARGALEGVFGIGRPDGDLVLLASFGEVRALDAATGAPRWTLPVPGTTPPDRVSLHGARRWLATPSRLFAQSDDGVAAIDAERGCLIWNRKLAVDGGRYLAADERWLVVGGRTLSVHEAATGRPVASFAAPPEVCASCEGEVGAALVAGTLVLWWASSTGALVGIDPGDGHTRWVRRGGLRQVAVADDVVFTRSDHGVVRALDPATGEPRWTWHAGNEWVTRIRAVPDLAGGAGLAVTANDGTALFARAAAAPATAWATIEGTLRVDGAAGAGLHVLVGDEVVEADAAGRFTAAAPARGSLIVQPATVDAALRGDGLRCFAFRGAARVVVDLERGGPRHAVALDFERRRVPCPDQ